MSSGLVVLVMAGLVAGCGADTGEASDATVTPDATSRSEATASSGLTAEYRCTDDSQPVSAVFDNDTDPPSMLLTWGQRSVNLVQEPSGSGIRYAGADVAYQEHQGDVTIDFEGTELTCTVS